MSGHLSRRSLLIGGGALAAAALVTPRAQAIFPAADRALRSETVAFGDAGRVLVPAGERHLVVPDSRVLRGQSGTDAALAAEADWLDSPADWTDAVDPRWAPLLRSSTLDLGVLSTGLPVAVAGWSTHWRYAWPRDGAHVAAALVALGRPEEARRQLLFFQDAQERDPDRWFHARYHLDGSPVADGRARQFDGLGWLLWAADRVVADDPSAGPVLTPLMRRSTALLVGAVRDGLPPVSPDYWEVPERRVTLGTTATTHSGLTAAVGDALAPLLDDDLRAAADATREHVLTRVRTDFVDRGYPRHRGRRLPDAGITMLTPPYVPLADPAVARDLAGIRARLTQPAGGVSPGLGWRRDGVSWTPQTALFASAHAHLGQRDAAAGLLDWLARHRTDAGSLPEKVLADGSPAEVAPLAWTAALVILALEAMTTG